jgi:hypothetical protein
MNQNQVKLIQSRLKSRGARFTLEAIRTFIFTNYHDEELTEDQISAIVEKMLSELSEIVPASVETEPTDSTLSLREKQELIEQVASTLDINLPVQEIKSISQKMDWALSDRASLKDRIKSAIIAWIDYHVDQDLEDTDSLIQEVQGHLATKLQQSNRHFTQKAEDFSLEVTKAVEHFRATEATVLSFFQIPS